jgi:Flp pilus assembly protein TadD
VTLPLATHTGDPVDEELCAGDDAFEQGNLDVALRNYSDARKKAPKRAAPLVGVARVAVAKVGAPLDYAAAKGNRALAGAADQLRKAVKLDATFGPGFVELGRALLLLGDAPAAINALRTGAQLLPDKAEPHSALGVALLATGHPDESLTELAHAVDLDPGSAPRHGNEGTVLFMLGRVADAIHEYEIQVHLADNDARAHSDLGTALLAHNEVTKAEAELRRAIALDGSRAAFHSNLGYALQIENKVPDAIAEYHEALRIDPKSASAWINLATALAKEPSTRKDARAALEKARSLDPTDPRVKANLEELESLEKGGSAGGPHP